MRLAAACVALAASSPAWAGSYEFTFWGSYVHQRDCWEVPDFCEHGPPPDLTGSWTGNLTLDLPTGGNGVHDLGSAGAVLTSTFEGLGSGWSPLWMSGTMTVADGLVTSIDGRADTWQDGWFSFSGLSMFMYFPPQHHAGSYEGSASLTFMSASVLPEPGAWALLAAGLCALWRHARRAGLATAGPAPGAARP
jgi:hypothetical protein